jgi:glycosyltransferase involved in cell wall biosynthesis
MKLTFCYRHIAPYHHAQLTAMAQAGHDVTVLSYGNFSGAAFAQQAAHPRSFRVINIHEPEGAWNVLHQALAESTPDVILFPGWGHAYALAALSWGVRYKIPCIVISDSQEYDYSRHWWQEQIKRRIIRRFSAGFVAGKRSYEYLANLGMPAKHIVIGCDIVDNEHFSHGAQDADEVAGSLRKQLGLPNRFFLAVNRLIPVKNIHVILKAYASYRAKGAPGDWKLVIVGDGPLRATLLEHAHALKIESSVSFAGAKTYDDMPRYYSLASALILASTQETWGFVVNEAMATGIPVIVSEHCGCASDLVHDGKNGFTFPPEDIERLGEIMIDLSSGRYDLAAMGRQGREVIDNYSLKRYVGSLEAVVAIAREASPKKMSWLDNQILSLCIGRLQAQ